MTMSFEPEILFPENPYEAAILFIAVMAYPELGAGRIGEPGYKFAKALKDYGLWSLSKSRGRRRLKEMIHDPNFKVPRKRDFEGTLERGLRRVRRRAAAYGLFGTQLLNGFFNVRALGAKAIQDGKDDDAFHLNAEGNFGPAKAELWEKGTREIGAILSRSESSWSERFGLNKTNDSADRRQKVKDLKRRAYKPSIPVMHMAHAFNHVIDEVALKIEGFDKREPFNAMLFNSEKWIWDAIDSAEKWRIGIKQGHMIDFDSNNLIVLSRSINSN